MAYTALDTNDNVEQVILNMKLASIKTKLQEIADITINLPYKITTDGLIPIKCYKEVSVISF